MAEITRHFTTTVNIKFNNKVLLHFHKKLKMWIPVGGHIDRDELPQECAVREAKEESGLDVELMKTKQFLNMPTELILPHSMNLHNINEFHQHINFDFFAIAKSDKINVPAHESQELKWFSKAEIEKSEVILPDVKKLALEILRL